jgi:hypothetical protein
MLYAFSHFSHICRQSYSQRDLALLASQCVHEIRFQWRNTACGQLCTTNKDDMGHTL